MTMNRRNFLKLGAAATALGSLPLVGCAPGEPREGAKPQVVVIGGGYGGATAAKYLRMWGGNIPVTLVERNPNFISCPFSNLVIGGSRTIEQQTVGYDNLSKKYGIKILRDEVIGIDPGKRLVRLAGGGSLSYDRLIVAPGIDFMYSQLANLASPEAQERVPHAWKAGAQTVILRKQLEAMPDGGVYILGIPKAPYRCPPGPYERACQVAHYFKTSKPRSKVIILDANPDITSKKGLFTKAWQELYPGMVEYHNNHGVNEVDIANKVVMTDFGNFKGDVLNIVPPQRAGKAAQLAGAVNVDNRWCGVDFLTYESKAQKNVHVIGDAISATLPKSGHMANNQAHVAAAAVIALTNNQQPIQDPRFANTCYSMLSDKEAVHVAAVYGYDPAQKVMAAAEGSSGVSDARSEIEARYAHAWASNIWNDMLG